MKILSGLTGTINSLTSVVIALLGLGIVVSLLGGNVPFVGGVADNIVSLVQGLGDAGIVGLVAAIIIQDEQILCFQLGESKLPYISKKYEFPGGKIEAGETLRETFIWKHNRLGGQKE